MSPVADNVEELPLRIGRDELDQITQKERSYSRNLAMLGFIGSLATGILAAGIVFGNVQSTLKTLSETQASLTNAINGLRDDASKFMANNVGTRVEIDNLKVALERERQDRMRDAQQVHK